MNRREKFYEQIPEVTGTMVKTEIDLIEQIDDEVRKLYKAIDDPETISNSIMKLAILNQGLGNWWVEAANEARILESNYKFLVDKTKLELVKGDNSATVSESKSKVQHKPDLDKYNEAQYRADVIKTKRSDTSTVIDTARSRLATIRDDLRKEA